MACLPYVEICNAHQPIANDQRVRFSYLLRFTRELCCRREIALVHQQFKQHLAQKSVWKSRSLGFFTNQIQSERVNRWMLERYWTHRNSLFSLWRCLVYLLELFCANIITNTMKRDYSETKKKLKKKGNHICMQLSKRAIISVKWTQHSP